MPVYVAAKHRVCARRWVGWVAVWGRKRYALATVRVTEITMSDNADAKPSSQPAAPSLAVRVFRPVSRAWLAATGFKVIGRFPDDAKFIVIAAPHTTNWDLPHALAAGIQFGRAIHWMGKASIFKFPFGGLMRWLGGISIDRSKSTNAVGAMVNEFAERDSLALVVAPAGTRSANVPWKSGFYHIAYGAKVPLVCAYIDYTRREIGIADTIVPSGDYEADLKKIQSIYAAIMSRPK
jgi:1-acyl-sn-glycerol-3-phosphate acyltransferase